MRLTEEEEEQIRTVIRRYETDSRVQEMKHFIQHGAVTTYAHCLNVTRCSLWLNHRLRLCADDETLIAGAFLHDFYLYDWHQKDGGTHRLHGFRHARTACENAVLCFHVSLEVQKIIFCHMWPLNVTAVPSSRAAAIVCAADKWCALMETLCD